MLPIALNVRLLQAAKDSQYEMDKNTGVCKQPLAREDAPVRLIKALDVTATVEVKVTQ